MRTATVGIDIGTSAVKVIAVALDGEVLGRASRTYPTKTPAPGFVEQSPADWWEATAAATRALLAGLADTTVAGIGLSGQLNGFVLIGDDDAPLCDAPIWLDTRAVAETEDLSRRFAAVLEARVAAGLSPIAVVTKLAWMARHKPDLVARTRRILLVKDFILWKLTGVAATDPSDASATAMMDAATFEWVLDLCRGAGFDPALLPPIRPSTGVAGQVTAAAAAATGLPEGAPVVPGGGDVAALAVGCGVVGTGALGVTLGTAGHVVLSEDRLPMNAAASGIWHLPHADPKRRIWLGLVMSGGLSLAWFHRALAAGCAAPLAFEAMAALADGVPPGAGGVTFLPFLEGAATPYGAPLARAGFHGLSSSHGAAEMVRAVMEGVAFNVRQCVERFEELGGSAGEVRIAEGGARVDGWCQIIADVLRRPVTRIRELDASALGAALMAQVGVSGDSLDAVVARTVGLGARFLPDAAGGPAYDTAYRRYRERAESEVRLSRGDP